LSESKPTGTVVGYDRPPRRPGALKCFTGDTGGDQQGVALRCGFGVVGPNQSWHSQDEEHLRVVMVGQPHMLTVEGQHRDAVFFERSNPHQTSVFQIAKRGRDLEYRDAPTTVYRSAVLAPHHGSSLRKPRSRSGNAKYTNRQLPGGRPRVELIGVGM